MTASPRELENRIVGCYALEIAGKNFFSIQLRLEEKYLLELKNQKTISKKTFLSLLINELFYNWYFKQFGKFFNSLFNFRNFCLKI